ncbi:hypothetical protein LTR72_004399 [Exophiala xenobiotica]|nr:hypothetical protein LTR72_004399 [Exophiala xenobiotica]KAK5293701.1 hypothetical protein LTR14_004592 [Exophiala xenobiotica]KAK5447196.1 hypothetical protein LTR18_002775 [Exophiala xenobiotica]KAK5496754.1 hypothetical protein LTR55_001244 [Exophiala xenobiotica]
MLDPLSHSRDPLHATDDPADLLSDLQSRARSLLDEFRAYQAHLKSWNKQHEVELRTFRRGVESEVKSLERITKKFTTASEKGTAFPRTEVEKSPQLHALRSSNLSFFEAVWDVAKSSHAITALGKKIYFPLAQTRNDEGSNDAISTCKRHPLKGMVLVDIVTDNGLEWIKVSTISEKRLLFEMAKEGWESYADFSDDSGTDDGEGSSKRRTGKLELVRLAEELQAASKGIRVHFRHVHVRFVLPNIHEGVIGDVDKFLADLRATGVAVQCGISPKDTYGTKPIPIPNFDRMKPAMAPVPLTDTINIDCTILLAMISDISHLRRQDMSAGCNPTSATFHKAIQRQIESEESHPLLPEEIYPVLPGRALECTSHSAQRMREIVQCMGTTSERTRADIFLGEGAFKGQSSSDLRRAFAEHSIHAVPEQIQFPIKVVDFDAERAFSARRNDCSQSALRCNDFTSSIASRVVSAMPLTPINSSVFLYGWVRRIVTLTSNRAVATGLLKTINELLDEHEEDESSGVVDNESFVGPQIYICETARSLVGKARSKPAEQPCSGTSFLDEGDPYDGRAEAKGHQLLGTQDRLSIG